MKKIKGRLRLLFRDKERKDRGQYSKRTAATVLSVVSVITCLLTIGGYLFLKYEFQDTNVLRDWSAEHPVLGAICMILICAVQVVVALIPGEVVEIAAGYVFGAVWGTVLCLFGILLGSVCSILLARRFGRKLVESLYPRERLDALPILNEPSKRNALTALLFLIPGTPKDLLTYVIGLTDMSIPLYILITSVCRLPSILTSTLSGDALGDNRLLHALWFLIATGAISLGGYILYQFIRRGLEKRRAKKAEEKKDDSK